MTDWRWLSALSLLMILSTVFLTAWTSRMFLSCCACISRSHSRLGWGCGCGWGVVDVLLGDCCCSLTDDCRLIRLLYMLLSVGSAQVNTICEGN